MPRQKEQLKYSVLSAIIGSLLWLLLDQIYIAMNFSDYFVPRLVSLSLGVFLGIFLVLGIIGKSQKPSFSLILPAFLIYLAILLPIIFVTYVVPAFTVTVPPFLTPFELFLDWLKYGVPILAIFILIGITAGIIMVRLTSKLKYDTFYFIFASLIGIGAGTMLIRTSWAVRFAVPYLPLFPYFSLLILIGTLVAIVLLQIAWLRKQQISNIHTCMSIAFWIIAFIIIIFLYEWVTYVHPPWF